MRPELVSAAAFALLTATIGSAAPPRKPPPASRLSLVQAQCPGPPPAPCSAAFTFASGTAILTPSKEPAPTCPGGKSPRGGQVKLDGVEKNGAPFTGTLQASITLKSTFATDAHNGNCDLSGVQITLPSLTGSISCRGGKCRGDLIGAGCLPKNCTDTMLTTEFVSLVVNDDAGQPLAAPGTFVVPTKNDLP
jgi:hypothetical protein